VELIHRLAELGFAGRVVEQQPEPGWVLRCRAEQSDRPRLARVKLLVAARIAGATAVMDVIVRRGIVATVRMRDDSARPRRR
jgi:hypothetical protein